MGRCPGDARPRLSAGGTELLCASSGATLTILFLSHGENVFVRALDGAIIAAQVMDASLGADRLGPISVQPL